MNKVAFLISFVFSAVAFAQVTINVKPGGWSKAYPLKAFEDMGCDGTVQAQISAATNQVHVKFSDLKRSNANKITCNKFDITRNGEAVVDYQAKTIRDEDPSFTLPERVIAPGGFIVGQENAVQVVIYNANNKKRNDKIELRFTDFGIAGRTGVGNRQTGGAPVAPAPGTLPSSGSNQSNY